MSGKQGLQKFNFLFQNDQNKLFDIKNTKIFINKMPKLFRKSFFGRSTPFEL